WFYPTIPEVIEVAKASNAHNFISQMTTGIPGIMGEDVSAIMHKVTEVLRGGDGLMSVEERLDEMARIKNGAFVTTSVIYILREAKRYEFVEGLCEEMERLKDRKTRKAGFEPDVAVYKVMLHTLYCLARPGDVDAIHLIANAMIDISEIIERDVYSYMLKSFCTSGRIREALEVLRNMKNKDIAIEPDHFQTLLNGMCRADRMTDALEIVDILKRKDVVDKNIYGMRVFNGLLEKKRTSAGNQFEKAFDMYNTMLKTGLELDSVAITAVVAGYVQQNRVSEAWEVVKNMEDKGMKLTSKCYMIFIKELSETYNMAMKIAGKGKDFGYMRVLFNEMKRKGLLVSSDTWTIMILQYGRIGLTEIALKIFKEMKESCCRPNICTYKSLIISLCGKKGRKDKELLEIYLECLCEVDNVLEAKRCVNNLCSLGFSTPLANSLCIRALCRAGKVDEALLMADEVGDKDQNTLNGYIYGKL
ncbi:putative pentatricopeptide repeat-containing protein, partial [Tanacetum coccineum]